MSIIVQKFGGTSVATAEKILGAAKRAAATKNAGHQVVMVVSARGKKTDELVSLAAELNESPAAREMDVLLSTGEQETISLMSMALHSLGEKAVSMTGAQMGIETDSSFSRARIKRIDAKRIKKFLDDGRIVVGAGFQGTDAEGNITTFGRGGSDTTASALAAVLNADLCEIYTDVEGVFTTDPRVVKDAKKVEQISYDEMLELASLGAGVMHSRSIEFAKKYHVPLRVRPSFSDGEGTLVAPLPADDMPVVTGVAFVREEVRVSLSDIPDKPGVLSTIFSCMAARKIPIDLVVQDIGTGGLAETTFTVPKDDLAETLSAAGEAIKKLGAGEVKHTLNLAKVSIVGQGMQYHTGVAAQLFQTLAEKSANISMISTSEIKTSVLVDRDQCDAIVIAVHEGFSLHEKNSSRPSIGKEVSKPESGIATSPKMEPNATVSGPGGMEDIVVSEVEVDTTQSRITLRNIPDQPGTAASIFRTVSDGGVMVDLIVQNIGEVGSANLSFTVPRDQVETTLKLVDDCSSDWSNLEVSHDAKIAKLSVVGIGVRSHTGVGEKMFSALSDANINVQMVGTSEMRMTAIIDEASAEKAKEVLQNTFGL